MTLTLLLVEDNPADARLVREALAERSERTRLQWMPNGQLALERLRSTTQPLPDLVLLDLNLPGLHGLEVLSAIKSDPNLRSLPVVVLTSSAAPSDETAAYAAHADAFVPKPSDFTDFVDVIDKICNDWCAKLSFPAPSNSELAR